MLTQHILYQVLNSTRSAGFASIVSELIIANYDPLQTITSLSVASQLAAA